MEPSRNVTTPVSSVRDPGIGPPALRAFLVLIGALVLQLFASLAMAIVAIAIEAGMRYVYTGNVHDCDGSSTWCHACGELLIERDWYELGDWNVVVAGGRAACASCAAELPGVFESEPGHWGSRRRPIRATA